MEQGTVATWKGSYGFIRGTDGRSLFVHQSKLNMRGYRQLEPGQCVQFETGTDDLGRPCAVNVEVVEG